MENREVLGVIYTRVSTKAQVQEGVSLENQERTLRKLLESKGCTNIKLFSDAGISGRSLEKRIDCMDAIEYCISKKVKYFAFYDPSRLARNTNDALAIFGLLIKNNIEIVSAMGNFDNTPYGKLIFTTQSGFAQFQSDLNSQKVKESMQIKIKEGLHVAQPPCGYKNIRDENGKAWIVVDPINARILKEGLSKFARDEFITQKDLLSFLQEKGLRSSKKKAIGDISLQFVHHILRTPFYCGYKKYIDGLIVSKHPYDTLITIDEFYNIQKILNRGKRKVKHYKKLNNNFPLKHFTSCSKCGKKLVGYSNSNGKGKNFDYYDCKTKGCHNTQQAYLLKEKFLEKVTTLTPAKEKISLFKEIFKEKYIETLKQKKDQAKELSNKINSLLEERKEVLSILPKVSLKAIIDSYEFKIENIDVEIKRLHQNKAVLEKEENLEPIINGAVDLLESPALLWEEANLNTKIRFQKWLFPQGITCHVESELRTQQICLTYEVLNSLNYENQIWWTLSDSNRPPPRCKRGALAK